MAKLALFPPFPAAQPPSHPASHPATHDSSFLNKITPDYFKIIQDYFKDASTLIQD